MPQHSAHEQYLLELINAERAEAGVQPLAFDNDLSESAEGHSRWMLGSDSFSHTGSGGSSPTQRIKAAGYSLDGSWATGENIAWATTRAPSGYNDEVRLLHNNLMNSPGHRANLLNPEFREVGLGLEVGDYSGRQSAFVTENFGKTGSTLFLTGVAFDDRDGDRFYDPGEGLGGITVTAKGSTGAALQTTTSGAGGYDLALKSGTYTVTFSGAGIESSTQEVTIGTKNVKRDLVDPATKKTTVADAADPAPTEPNDPGPTPPADQTNQPTTPIQPTAPTTPKQPVQQDGAEDPAPQPSSGHDWLAQFLQKLGGNFWSNGTLAEDEGGDDRISADADLALVDGALEFVPSKAALADLGELSDDIHDWAAGLSDKIADVAETVDLPKAALLADEGDALAAKILAQFSGHAGLDADLAA